MRGGAIPLLAWGTVLLVLYVGNWIWEGRPIQFGETLLAVLIVYASAVIIWLARREAIRPGAPALNADPEPVAQMSIGAVLAGLSVATMLFGLVWAIFLLYFGAGMLLLSLGRLAIELHSERETRERARQRARDAEPRPE